MCWKKRKGTAKQKMGPAKKSKGYGPTHFNVRESRNLSDGVHQAVPRKSRLVSAPASREGMAMPNAAAIQKLSGDNWDEWHFEVKNALACAGLGAALRVTALGGPGERRSGAGSSGSGSGAAAGTSPISVAAEAAADALHAAAAAATPSATPTAAAAASSRALPVDVDERAHAFICSTVNVRKYRGLCERHTTARGLWEALRDMHVSKVLASRSLLVRQAASLRMSEEESVQDYWARAEDLHEQLNLTEPYGETLTQALEGLPAGFDIVVNEVLRKPVASRPTFVEVLPLLLVQERVLTRRQPAAVALSVRLGGSQGGASNRGRGQGRSGGVGGSGFQGECYKCFQWGHQAHQCPNRPRSPSPSLRGHSPVTYSGGASRPPTPGPGGGRAPAWGGSSSGRGRDPSPSASRYPASTSRSSVAFQGLAVSNAMSVVSKPLLRGEWLVDSGCSRHLTPHRDILQGYEPLPVPHTIICGNGSTMAATGQGSVQFRGAGGELTLLNVLHVPAAEGSLVSVGKATRAGGVVHFTPHGCCINMPGTGCSITARQIEEDLFLLDSKPVLAADSYRMVARAGDPMTLHHRLGHPGYRQLARLTREGMVTGTSVKAAHCEAAADSGNLCEPCVLAKQHRFVAVEHQGLGGAVKHVSKSVVFDEQAVLRHYAPAPVLGPVALAAPPEGEASRGGVGTKGAAGDSLGSRGGTPVVTPTVTPASSSSASSRECGGEAGGGGQAGSGGVPPTALRGSPGWDGEGGDGAGLGGAGVVGLGGDGAGGMERTPESLAAPAPEQASPLLRRGERVRKAVRFADYVTVCYSARNVSCNSSEGVGSSGSSGRRERVALVGSRAAAIGFSTKRRFSKAVSRPEAEEWGRAVDAKMARVQLLPAAASLWHEADMVADALTKALPGQKFGKCKEGMGVG
ncbi:hypothetical protein QJQ45_009690 [Haematococcus lacustris]|nr:hypothetical protein QJQ45_009690 [Haematococcus lacustris]